MKERYQYFLTSYGRTMICHKPFLVGTGPLPVEPMRTGSLALAKAWGGNLNEFSCEETPNKVFESLSNDDAAIVQLVGDAAISNAASGSWLEALAAWRQPTVLITMPLSSGDISGTAFAYVALCKVLRVPLVGILQLGGLWNPNLRREDGLPWCGWIPSEERMLTSKIGNRNYHLDMKLESLAVILRLRINEII